MNVLASAIDSPEGPAGELDYERHASEHDQAHVIEPHRWLATREHVHQEAVDGENLGGAVCHTLLRVKHCLDKSWPLEVDLRDGSEDLEVIEEDL